MQDCDMDGFVNGNNRQKYKKVTYCSENINLWQNRYVLFKSHGNQKQHSDLILEVRFIHNITTAQENRREKYQWQLDFMFWIYWRVLSDYQISVWFKPKQTSRSIKIPRKICKNMFLHLTAPFIQPSLTCSIAIILPSYFYQTFTHL